MSLNFIQWNCNGCKTHYPELKVLMLEKSPLIICLQETHLRPGENYKLRGYNCVRKDGIPLVRSRGGVAIFSKSNIPMNEIVIHSNLEVVAAQIDYPYKMTICNLYLPEYNWNINDLTNITSQLPQPYLLVGDFNAHNPLWGSDHIDPRGRIIEEFIDEIDAVLLNTGEATYLNARSNNFSAIDLTISSPQLARRFTWTSLNDHFPTDHCPILIEISSEYALPHHGNKKWRLEQANWTAYAENLNLPVLEGDINNTVGNITEAILASAIQHIPMSEGYRPRRCVPWWNEEVKNAIRMKKRALNTFKRHPTNDNMILFKQARARARRIIVQSKRNSWQTYMLSITTNTSTSDVWHKIKKISGNNFSEPSPVLMEDGQLI